LKVNGLRSKTSLYPKRSADKAIDETPRQNNRMKRPGSADERRFAKQRRSSGAS